MKANPPTSRRALLAAAAGAAAATAAHMASRVPAVAAADSDPLTLGQANTATSDTSLSAPSQGAVIVVQNTDTTVLGSALVGVSEEGTGVAGYTIHRHGVYGGAMGNDGRGVRGVASGFKGIGVLGEGEGAATGLRGTSEIGYGLDVSGRVRFQTRSGRTAVSAGTTSFVKTLSGVTTASIVIAVLQTNESGTWVRAVVSASGRFRVYFNKALPSSSVVGWLVLN